MSDVWVRYKTGDDIYSKFVVDEADGGCMAVSSYQARCIAAALQREHEAEVKKAARRKKR